MNKKLRNGLLGVAIALSLMVAGNKVYQFYLDHTPLAQPGECIKFTDSQVGEVKLYVMANNNAEGYTQAIIEVEVPGLFVGMGSAKMQIPGAITYKELRTLGAKKASCD